MWCHLCKMKFTDQEIFKVHIMKKHRLTSEFYEDYSNSENSEQEEIDESEIIENDKEVNESDEEMDENDEEMNEQNPDSEEFSSDDNCNDSKSKIYADTSKINTRSKTKKNKFYPQKVKSKSKTHSSQDTKDYGRNQLLSTSKRQGFDFDSRNILIWLLKFKEMCRKFTLPLQPRLFKKIKTVHKEIFDNYNSTISNEVTSAVLKVYEELDSVIQRHIRSINEKL